ncbi:MAG: AAA family ATPase [Clostridia bacterium]|nr:AAA family ATPase [Clostridia bacterium]
MKAIDFKKANAFSLVMDLLYNVWVIALAGIVGFCGCQIYYFAFKKQSYTSSMTIAINLSGYTTSATVTSLSRTIEICEIYESVLASSTLKAIVEEDMGAPMTGEVSVKQNEKTNLIDISVTDTSSQKAYETLKSIFKNYPIITENSLNNIIVSVISAPDLPVSVSNPNASRNVSIFFGFVGAFICTLLIMFFSFMRDTVKNISDVDTMLECNLFGTVYHVNKRKRKIGLKNDGLLLNNPLIDYSFRNSFSEIAIKLESVQRTRGMKSIVVTSIAENEGKTTVIVNIAIALANMGKKVVVVDSDLKLPAVYKFFKQIDIKPENDIISYIKGKSDYNSVVMHDHITGVSIVCGKSKHYNTAKTLSSDAYKELISRLYEDFDFVLIDTPPGGVAIDAETVCEFCDGMLFVVRQDFAYVEAINDYIINFDEEKLIGCIFNDVSELKIRRDKIEEQQI